MEKTKQKLKKGVAQFTLIGRFKRKYYNEECTTFKLNQVSETTGFISNRFNLNLDCGQGNFVGAEMWGGYNPKKESLIYVHGVKTENDKTVDDWNNFFSIKWEERFNEEVLETIGKQCFIKIGVEKDTKGNTVIKDFLSQYDAIQYLNDNLDDDTVINIKGDIKYSFYNGELQVKKEIKSVFLSKVENEEEFKAIGTQSILIDKNSIGTPDKEKRIIPIDARVIDYHSDTKQNIPYNVTFELAYDESSAERVKRLISRFLKPKKNITEIQVEFKIVESAQTVNIEMEDLDDDIKFLIEEGYTTIEEVSKKAIGGTGQREKKFIIVGPVIKKVAIEGETKPQVSAELEKYTEEDLEVNLGTEESVVVENEDVVSSDDMSDLDELLGL